MVVGRPYESDGPVLIQLAGTNDEQARVLVTNPDALEVIRQPFKRGEVVYHVGEPDSEIRTVVTDEEDGHVLLARHLDGSEVMEWSVEDFERRP